MMISSIGMTEKTSSIKKSAFTLIEILLVMAVMAVIAGLTVPSFGRSFKALKLKKTAEDVAFLMRYAQSRAVSKSQTLSLAFNSERSQYWISQGATDDMSSGRISSHLGRPRKIPTGVDVELEQESMSFHPDGSIDKQYVYVCQEDRCYTISSREQRGAVHVFDEKLELD